MAVRFDTSSWLPGAVLFGRAGFGVLGRDIPSTGTHGAAYAFKSLSLPADADKEICGRIESLPGAGKLDADEDTSFVLSGAPDGTHNTVWRLFVDGVDQGTATATATIGVTEVTLAGANATQAHTSAAGAIQQTHVLASAPARQTNASSAGAITQTHVLVGANAQQANVSSVGAIAVGVVINLAGANAVQAAQSSSGAITQTHALVAAPSVQDNVASASAIVQTHVLAAASALQRNLSSVGRITRVHELEGAGAVQRHTSSTGKIILGVLSTVAANRLLHIPAEDRIRRIEAENRILGTR